MIAHAVLPESLLVPVWHTRRFQVRPLMQQSQPIKDVGAILYGEPVASPIFIVKAMACFWSPLVHRCHLYPLDTSIVSCQTSKQFTGPARQRRSHGNSSDHDVFVVTIEAPFRCNRFAIIPSCLLTGNGRFPWRSLPSCTAPTEYSVNKQPRLVTRPGLAIATMSFTVSR